MPPAPRFASVVANTIHECAPDHSTHVIEVGELREAALEMTMLCEAAYDTAKAHLLRHGLTVVDPKALRLIETHQDMLETALAKALGNGSGQ